MKRLVAVLALLVLPACAAEGLRDGDSIARFDAPRTVHLAPDGLRVVIADLGTGHDDGRVLLVDPRDGETRVLMSGLPSTRGSGQRYADLAGPSGAAMAPDGVVCAVIGDANRPGRGFNTMRCSDGLVVDLKQFEADFNPDGREVASNPFDVIWDGREGWFVSDAAANTVLAIDRRGVVAVAATFPSVLSEKPGEGPEGVPTGLSLFVTGRGERELGVALFAGGLALITPNSDRPVVVMKSKAANPIALVGDGKTTTELSYSADVIAASGVVVTARTFHNATGLARLADGRYIVCEEARARCRVVTAKP